MPCTPRDPSPAPRSGASDDAGPLSPDQRHALLRAGERGRVVLRAARVATFTGWSVGSFGILSLLFGLVGDPSGLLVGAALLAVAWNEFRGRGLLRRLEPRGADVLGWNQVAILGVVAAYCLWAAWKARTDPGGSLRQLEEMAGLPEDYVADLAATLYGLVALVVAAVQWLLARYHFRRRSMLESYLEETPRWIVELQREGRLEG